MPKLRHKIRCEGKCDMVRLKRAPRGYLVGYKCSRCDRRYRWFSLATRKRWELKGIKFIANAET